MKNGLRNLCFAVWTVLGLVLIAHELGKPAEAQSPGSAITGFSLDGGFFYVIGPDGEIYKRQNENGQLWGAVVDMGNFWGGASPTSITPQTWSEIKAKFAPKTGGGK